MRGPRGGILKIPSFSSHGGAREGAGRKRRHRRTSEFLSLSIYELRRLGALSSGARFTARVDGTEDLLAGHAIGNQLVLRWLTSVYHVELERTLCALGGSRQWFQCPSCWKRVAILRFGRRGAGCAHCLDLCYPSQSEGWIDRGHEEERRLLQKLGGYLRPKGMHLKTYEAHISKALLIAERRHAVMEYVESYL